MTSSPDLIHELRASRPAAPATLRARVRELSAERPAQAPSGRFRFPARRVTLIAIPAAAALALASAGVVGLSRSDVAPTESLAQRDKAESFDAQTTQPPPSSEAGRLADQAQGSGAATNADRAQKVTATLTVEVRDSEAVSRAAQGALDLTRSLGGFVVSSSVATGEEGSASITIRVPVDRVQDAIAGLSSLGRIISQQVTVEDRQESIDAFQRRSRSLRSQIALVNARLESESLDSETRAKLEVRLKNLRTDLLGARRSIGILRSEARMSTIQLTVVTPGAFGAVAPPARLDRTIDEALNVLAWEAVVALAVLIVLAPFALVAFAAWLGRRFYRRREEERLLAT
ncbi:MAG TPA: DUF4349 domain-containing protein [Gaiellaceae bacterium]|nr:DUF4349 domain-containing protein [Gaiellaceae bacterium]